MRHLESPGIRSILRILLVIMISGLTPVIIPAVDTAPASPGLTVGGFAAMIATRLQSAESPMAPLSPEEGQALLRKAGIKIRRNAAALLTEGDAVDILRQFGVNLETASPANLLDTERATSIVGVFGRTLASKTGVLASDNPSRSTAQGIRAFSGPVLETAIEDCQLLDKTQDCQTCCRALSGSDQNDFHTNRICAKACNTKSRNVSAAEPTP